MKTWKVTYEPHVRNEVATDFKNGNLTADDVKVIKRWVHEVETDGWIQAKANKNWRDHELLRGKWKGHRAVSFSYSGRLIYRVEEGHLIVVVVRVTPKHDYL